MAKKIHIKRKKIIIILLIIALALPVGITLSKYVKGFLNYYIAKSNSFFFNSDKLKEGGLNYDINNWGGVESVDIQFQLNNYQNNILTSAGDIAYSLTVTCPNDVTCSINSTSGVIYEAEKNDNFILTITPQRTFDTNETMQVGVSATSSSPYVKTLSATFTFTVGRKGISYEIIDSATSPYLSYVITNAINQYTVDEAFGSYSVNDLISAETYLTLSDANKAKCHCALITLTFDPTKVILDVTNNIINSSVSHLNTTVSGVDYISSITFKVDAMSSTSIRFYKIDVSKNYTYPFGTEPLVINFRAV